MKPNLTLNQAKKQHDLVIDICKTTTVFLFPGAIIAGFVIPLSPVIGTIMSVAALLFLVKKACEEGEKKRPLNETKSLRKAYYSTFESNPEQEEMTIKACQFFCDFLRGGAAIFDDCVSVKVRRQFEKGIEELSGSFSRP